MQLQAPIKQYICFIKWRGHRIVLALALFKVIKFSNCDWQRPAALFPGKAPPGPKSQKFFYIKCFS